MLFFAQAREAAGCGECQFEVEKALSESEFWALLAKQFSGLDSLRKSARLARSETYLQEGELIQSDDEIAVIPPVSGG